MELKLANGNSTDVSSFVLIVPYGIEISIFRSVKVILSKVLIVPYGIEMELLDQFPVVISVLIVPYGIEIASRL